MPPTTAEVTADGLKTVVAAGVTEAAKAEKAAREAKKADKVARKAKEKEEAARIAKITNEALRKSGLNVPNPADRPGGSRDASNVNMNKPQMIRLSEIVRGLGAHGDWSGRELERDFGQATKALFLDDADSGSVGIPATRSAFAKVVLEARINAGQPKALRSWAARAADSEALALQRLQAGDYRGAQMAMRDAGEATTGAGGALVPPEYLQNLYTLSLQTAVAFGNAPGVTRIPVNSNLVYFPRELVMPASDAYGEAAIMTPTDPTFAQQSITIKKQGGVNRFSNELLGDSTPEYEQIIGKSLARSVGLKQDYEYLEGDGTGAHVLGLRHYTGLTPGYTPATDGDDWAQSYSSSGPVLPGTQFPLKMLGTARAAGWEPNAWIGNPDVMSFGLAQVLDGNGRYLLESVGGVFGAPIPVPNIGALPTQITYVTPPWKAMLLGSPFLMTAQIPETETQGAHADCTHVFLGDWNFAHILERAALELARADQIYFTTDQTAVRMTARSAIVLLAPGAFMCQLGVRAPH